MLLRTANASSAKPSKWYRLLREIFRSYPFCGLVCFEFRIRRSWQFQLLGFLANSGHILKKLNFTSRLVAILRRCVRRCGGQRGPFFAAVAAARIWVQVWTQVRVQAQMREWVQTQVRAMVRPWPRVQVQVRATLGEDAFCAGAGKAGCGNAIGAPPLFRREHLPSGAKLHSCSRHCVVGALYWAQRAACWQRLVGRRRVFATFLQVKVGLRFRAGRGRGLRRTRRMR